MQGFTPTTDLKELQSTMRAIEQACASIQVPIILSRYNPPLVFFGSGEGENAEIRIMNSFSLVVKLD